MTSVFPRVMIAVLLAFSVWSVSLLPTSAEVSPQSTQTQRYFPWVPYGEVISDPRGFPDSGPYYGLITVQNLENEPIEWSSRDTATFGQLVQVISAELGPHESTTFAATEFVGTSGVIIEATMASDNSPARVAAVMRQVSASQPASPSETTGAHITVSGYTSLSRAGVAATPKIIPIAQTNSNWNTLIRITNFEPQDNAFVTVTLREHGGGDWTQLPGVSIPRGETHTLNMLDLVDEGWIGSVNISTPFDVGAVAERIKNETSMLMMNPARSQVQGDLFQVAPLVFRNWNNWNTGIGIVNLGFQDNEIKVTYFTPEGGEVHVDHLTIADRRMDFVYLPAGDGQPLAGSALIEGTLPFTAVVDEVKYFGDDGDTGHAMSYTVDYMQANPGQALAIPLFRKGHPSGSGDTSGIQIFNLFGHAEVEIRVFDMDGKPALSEPKILQLGVREGYTFYSLDIDELPIGFTGSVIIRNRPLEDQNSAVFAVSNIVNYDVQYDGSASFNTRWFEAPTPAPIPPIIILP